MGLSKGYPDHDTLKLRALEQDDPALLAAYLDERLTRKTGTPLSNARSALSDVIDSEATRCLAFLIERDPAIARSPDESGTTPLMVAASRGSARCLAILLPLSDAAAFDSGGASAFMHAARRGQAACAQALMPLSDIDARDYKHRNALLLACREGHSQLVELLAPLTRPYCRDADGFTALMAAAGAPTDHQARDCMLAALPFSNPSARDNNGFSALDHATRHQRPLCIELLLEALHPPALGRFALMARQIAWSAANRLDRFNGAPEFSARSALKNRALRALSWVDPMISTRRETAKHPHMRALMDRHALTLRERHALRNELGPATALPKGAKPRPRL